MTLDPSISNYFSEGVLIPPYYLFRAESATCAAPEILVIKNMTSPPPPIVKSKDGGGVVWSCMV